VGVLDGVGVAQEENLTRELLANLPGEVGGTKSA
jgi:hypothetical protein